MEHGIAHKLIDYKSYNERSQFDAEMLATLRAGEIDLVLTLGFMRIIGKELVREYRHRIINIHPSLLPAFPGVHSARQAWDYGVKLAGATVHFIDEGVDTGPIISQVAVAVDESAGPDELAAAILQEEHRILVEAVNHYTTGRLEIDGRRVRLRP